VPGTKLRAPSWPSSSVEKVPRYQNRRNHKNTQKTLSKTFTMLFSFCAVEKAQELKTHFLKTTNIKPL